jgi:hypothetical protein
MTDLEQEFSNPGPAWRGKPFWSWNGELRQEELIRQIHVMQEMGLGGFFMHSRTGLVTEYLGDEWFQFTNACAEEAARLGMEAWLYDEDRWPSGTAGGLVTEDPAHRMQFLHLRTVSGVEFRWDDSLLAAFTCRLDGTAYSDSARLISETPLAAYADKTVLAFTVEPMAPSSFYNGHTYVDTLSRAATERYISLTHDQYAARCGEHFGKSIRGIFTDEPHRGAVMTGFGVPNADRLWMTPWTGALPERFQEQFGHDLIECLPELFLYPEGRLVSTVKWQYMELLQQMFLQNYMQPLYEWCEAHGLRLTGHALHEDSLTAQAALQGSLMRFYEFQHDPGVDVLTEGNRNPRIVKQLTSAARQLGKPWLLSELYGCTGWQMNFRSHKEAGDWQALLGINLRCHHLSWYTMEGEAKRDYPASILHQSAWYTEYAYVESYFARLGLLLAQGEPVCDLLVLNPIESVWCQIGIGWADGMSAQLPAVQTLEQRYTEITDWLLNNQQDFDLGDEEMITRLASVQTDTDSTPRLRVGRMHYKVVVVPHMTTMRSSTLRLLTEFADAGGSVVFAGEAPLYIDAVLSDAAHKLAARTTRILWDTDSLLAACRAAAPPEVSLWDLEADAPCRDLHCQVRRDGEKTILVALNRNLERAYPQVQIRLRDDDAVQEWDCRTGTKWAVPSRLESDWQVWTTHFAPSGERAFVLTWEPEARLTERLPFTAIGQAVCKGPFSYTLSEPNVCVLDFARWRLNEDSWQEPQEILKADQAVRQALGIPARGGEMVQPWYRRKYHPEPPRRARLALSFEFFINTLPPDPVFLAVERPQVWKLTLNGTPLSSTTQDWWVDTAFSKIAVPGDALGLGRNELILETDFSEDINLEALYLLGGFGVTLEGTRKTLQTLPPMLAVDDIATQGFPFYGAPLTYHIPVPPHPVGARLRVQTPSFEAACCKVSGKIIAFPPYQAEIDISEETLDLEVFLTRRNTFGPLHQVPLRTGAYGPGNFITEGVSFTDAYQLYPAGLLEPPIVSWTDAE